MTWNNIDRIRQEIRYHLGLGFVRRLCRQISVGENYSPDDLATILGSGSMRLRLDANVQLAAAFRDTGNIAEAAACAERVMWLSGHAERYVDMHTEIMALAGDVEAIARACKRVGMHALRDGNVGRAIRYLNQGYHANETHRLSEKYEFDFEVLDRLAEDANRRSPGALTPRTPRRKLRIAYLTFGASHPGSVIISLLCSFARHHDKEAFDVAFFVPDAKPEPSAVAGLRAWEENVARLKSLSWPVYAEHASSADTAVTDTLRTLREYDADILITPAVLADYAHYYIAAARPATAVIGLTYGAPQQFAAPVLDLAICSHPHLVFESLTDCTHVPVEVDLPGPGDVVPADRVALGVPDDAVMMFVGGRPPKLQSRELWRAWASAMEARPELFLAVAGIQDVPSFAREFIPDPMRSRIQVFPWSDYYLRLIRASDIVLDTYPFGGGVMIMEAMSMSKPTLTFAHRLEGMFDPMNWSAAASWLPQELVVPREDFTDYRARLTRLAADQAFRESMGEQCRRRAAELCGSPARMVASCEKHYLRALRKVQRRASGQVV